MSLAMAAFVTAGSLQATPNPDAPPYAQQNWTQVPFFKNPSTCTQANVKGTYTLNATEGSHGGSLYAAYDGDWTGSVNLSNGNAIGTNDGNISGNTLSAPVVPLAGMIAFDGYGRYRVMLSGPFGYGPDSSYPTFMVFDGNYTMTGCVLNIITAFEPYPGNYDWFEFYAHINPLQNTLTFSAYLEDWYNYNSDWAEVYFGGMGGRASSAYSLIPFTTPTTAIPQT